MGNKSIELLVAERNSVQKQKDDVDAAITQKTAQQTSLASLLTDLNDGIDDLGGALPDNTVVPTISGTAKVGQTLTAAVGTWTGTPGPAYSYQWKVAGVAVSGAVASTYVPKTADIGKTVTVTVTGTNVLGTDSATSVATSAVIA